MIIWLASYPKSGNTWVRSFLSSLLYDENNEANFSSILNIKQYPLRSDFKNLINNLDDLNEISSNWLKSQSIINSDNKIKLLKTHHALVKIGKSNFTNHSCSLGAIYIVRDPRNVISSVLYHYSKKNYQEAKEFLFDEHRALGKKYNPDGHNQNNDMFTLITSWKTHYNSWKNFKKNYLLIKYENLVSEPKNEFRKISNYISKLMNLKIEDKKIDLAIKSNEFENLKRMEKKDGFKEAIKNKETGETKSFFNLGPNNKWQEKLDIEIKESIEEKFEIEMKELGYL